MENLDPPPPSTGDGVVVSVAVPMEESKELSRTSSFNEDVFTQHQTLSFVSPHAFGTLARNTKATTENHEKRIKALEGLDLMAGMEDKFAQMMKSILGPFMEKLQSQVLQPRRAVATGVAARRGPTAQPAAPR